MELKGNFISEFKDIDYKNLWALLEFQYILFAGLAINLFPAKGCYKYLQAFENENNIFREFGYSNSNLENYSHSRIVLSQNAAKEVWPTILQWIDKDS